MTALLDGPRQDSRVNLVVVAPIIPIEKGQLQVSRAFTAVTKEFSSGGASLVLNDLLGWIGPFCAFAWKARWPLCGARNIWNRWGAGSIRSASC